MTIMTLVAALLALFWGVIWALVLQFTRWGRFVARRRTWIAVTLGFAVDIIVLALVLPLMEWLNVVAIIAASAVPIVARSLFNEWAEVEAEIRAVERR